MNYSTLTRDFHAERATKSGTPWRHKSIICDGDFVNDLKAVGFFAPLAPGVSPVVGARIRREPNLPPVTLPCTHPESFKPKKKAWRDLGEELQGLFFHKALESQPGVKAFTLMLSRPVEALARAQGKHCLRWLHKRVERQLRPLGRSRGGPVQFWFAIEEGYKDGRLHIHGMISIGDFPSDKPYRKALKAAGGKWESRKGRQRQSASLLALQPAGFSWGWILGQERPQSAARAAAATCASLECRIGGGSLALRVRR